MYYMGHFAQCGNCSSLRFSPSVDTFRPQRSNSYAPHDHLPDNRRRWWLIIFLHYFLPFCRLRALRGLGAISLPFLTISLSLLIALNIRVFLLWPAGSLAPQNWIGLGLGFYPYVCFLLTLGSWSPYPFLFHLISYILWFRGSIHMMHGTTLGVLCFFFFF